MRVIWAITSGLILTTLVYLDDPDSSKHFFSERVNQFYTALHQRELKFSGLKLLTEKELQLMLPFEESNITWAARLGELEQRLMRHALIEKASAKLCGVDCFSFEIEEEVPRWVAIVNRVPWVLSEEGVFIYPLENISQQKLLRIQSQNELVLVKNLVIENISPGLVFGRLGLLKKVAANIQNELSDLKIESAEFISGKEVSLGFVDRPFSVVFGVGDEKQPQRIQSQVQRLATLISRLGEQIEQVEEIDLNFNQLGVVRFKEKPQST